MPGPHWTVAPCTSCQRDAFEAGDSFRELVDVFDGDVLECPLMQETEEADLPSPCIGVAAGLY